MYLSVKKTSINLDKKQTFLFLFTSFRCLSCSIQYTLKIKKIVVTVLLTKKNKHIINTTFYVLYLILSILKILLIIDFIDFILTFVSFKVITDFIIFKDIIDSIYPTKFH